MARFMGLVEGGRGEASRLGHESTGIGTHAKGWNVGVRVRGWANRDSDRFDVYATGGSHGAHGDVYIGTVELDDEGRLTFTDHRGDALERS